MIHARCGYPRDRDETLIAYLYDEIDPAERALFDAHLLTCARCRDELSALGGVRTRLARWSPPNPAFAITNQQSSIINRPWWSDIPAWAQVAAALLFLGVAAGLANLDVHYDRSGLTVRTGWSKPSAVPGAAAQTAASPAWRADLAALEQRLRTEFHAAEISATGPAATVSDSATLRRVRALVDESERRQARELALRLAEVMRDVEVQRQADLVKIDRSLGVIQNDTGVEVMKQRELLNYLVRASQRQ
jgi:hypothetical protein